MPTPKDLTGDLYRLGERTRVDPRTDFPQYAGDPVKSRSLALDVFAMIVFGAVVGALGLQFGLIAWIAALG